MKNETVKPTWICQILAPLGFLVDFVMEIGFGARFNVVAAFPRNGFKKPIQGLGHFFCRNAVAPALIFLLKNDAVEDFAQKLKDRLVEPIDKNLWV